MTQCEECGARNAEHATFCVRCGAELMHGAESGPGESTDALEPVTEATLALDQAPPAEAEEPADAGAAEELLREAGDLLAAGDADEAAAKCRDAIEIAPDLVAAYSLLGMAEEQRGNIVAAAGAYRRVLQLDPERKVEREKLELLYADGVAAHDGLGESAFERRVVMYAPWVAGVAAAFFVMMMLTAVGLRVHATNRAERVYAEQMQVAQAALDSGDYRQATSAFEAALAVRPGDSDAQRGLRYARRKLTSGGGRPAASASVSQPMPYQATLVPSAGPNPFAPIPIGSAQPQEPEPAPGQPPQTRTRSTPPPVMPGDERVVVGRQQTTTRSSDTIMPFEEVLDQPDDDREQPAADDDEGEEAEVAQQPRGEFTMWRSPPGPSQGSSAQEPPRSGSDNSHAERATQLRRQAQAAINSGDCDRGRELLDRAVEEFRADSERNPGRRQANQASIKSCETLRQQCAPGEDQ